VPTIAHIRASGRERLDSGIGEALELDAELADSKNHPRDSRDSSVPRAVNFKPGQKVITDSL
jgi:hypothetical protein